MAASNMKAVKLRIKSVQSTMQITKAMQLVAASKLNKAKKKADNSKPYFESLRESLRLIAEKNTEFQSPYTKVGTSEKWLYVVIAGDRGLAGGYNSNLFKLFEQERAGKEVAVIPIGKKTVEYCNQKKIPIVTQEFAEAAGIGVSDSFEIARIICDAYKKGEYGHVSLCYTRFVSMLKQTPGVTSLLPLSDFKIDVFPDEEGEVSASEQAKEEKTKEDSNAQPQKKAGGVILYEPDSEEVFNTIVPDYLAGLLYTSLNLSVASELAARRVAMEAATDNAQEMLDTLNLHYNRARQASITQEITEIVAGAEGV